jgi:RES domain
MDLQELESQLARIDSDSERISLLNSLLNGVNWSISCGMPALPMYRVTCWNTPPEAVCKLTYPPPECVKDYGRANHPNKPMLYLAAHPYSPIQELALELNKPFVVSTWTAVAKLRIIDLGGERKGHINSGTQTQDERSRQIVEFFSRAFCKIDADYMLTSTITHLLLDGHENSGSPFDAILYPSARSNALRENMVVKPNAADRVFILSKAVFGTMTDFSSDKRYGTFEPQQRIASISPCGDITWERTDGQPEHIRMEPANS